ncbi:MAG: phosphoribosyl-AMP cyclohydrolase [Roseovarius sp.]|nr:phosphoribosyl-AMP cyclohydrolase [Roseovarius sp.]MCY4206794.1 phosphoribosyl-AMP cyclohydrolase [Roseovarius sp.]MCY4316268.1 phosphoribosyl-AMP cyclohydrolase [Roseovarius sp.]
MAITETELANARKAWGDALIAIAKAYETDGIAKARKVAEGVLDAAYGYDFGPVLFKPTLASGEHTFRTTRKGALSYFVGHDADYPLDGGFGIKGWRQVESETAAVFINGDIAMWMGWVAMTSKDGLITKVDKSFGYRKDQEGTLRIILHHSSLPYQP